MASRIPEDIVQQVVNEDYSEACGSDEGIRSWHSAVRLEVGAEQSTEVDILIDELSVSFEADGWIATPWQRAP